MLPLSYRLIAGDVNVCLFDCVLLVRLVRLLGVPTNRSFNGCAPCQLCEMMCRNMDADEEDDDDYDDDGDSPTLTTVYHSYDEHSVTKKRL